jgi:integrase
MTKVWQKYQLEVSIMKDFYAEKRGKVYYIRFKDPLTGKILSARSSGQRNRDLAIKWAALEYEKMKSQAGMPTGKFGDWANLFFKEGCPHITRLLNQGKSYAESTRRDNRRYVDMFLLKDPISRMKLGEIGRGDIIDLQDRIVKAYGRTRSAQRIYQAFHIILNEAVIRGKLSANPSNGIAKISYQPKVRKPLTKAELDRFLDPKHWPNRTHWLMTMMARYTGLRAGEIRALYWEHLNPEEGSIMVLQNLPKNVSLEALRPPKWGKTRKAVYPKQLQVLLEKERKPTGLVFQEKDGSAVDYWLWHDSVKHARKASNITHAGIHALRHSLDTILAENGINQEVRKAIFGWTNAKTEQIYNHPEMYDVGKLSKKIQRVLKSGNSTNGELSKAGSD